MRRKQIKVLGMLLFYGVVSLISILLFSFGLLERLDWQIYDANFRIRGTVQPKEKIFIVGVDSESECYFGKSAAHLNLRRVFTKAIENLSARGAKVIALDYLLAKRSESDEKSEETDEKLAQAISEVTSSVVLAMAASGGKFLHADERFLEGASAEGVINVQEDKDGVLRRFNYNLYRVGGKHYLSFPVAVAAAYLDVEKLDRDPVSKEILLCPQQNGKNLYRVPETNLLINYAGPPGTFPQIPIWRASENSLDNYDLNGAIALIADVRVVGGDVFEAPTSYYAGGARGLVTMTGIEVHANAIRTILTQNYMKESSSTTRWLLLCAVLALSFFLFYFFSSHHQWLFILFLLGLLGGLFSLQYMMFLRKSLILPVSTPMVTLILHTGASLIYRILFLSRRERYVRNLFGRYVSEKVVRKMVDEEVPFDIEGHIKEISVMFADIRGFTPLSERLSARETASLLNKFFSEMITAVFSFDGTVDKLMGDCIMAFFNDPDEQPDHAERAAAVALDMVKRIDILKKSGVKGTNSLDIGIGINTGVATVGNLGAPKFYNYTAVGDTVNTASRLQGLTRDYGVHIITSQATFEKISKNFLCRRLDSVRVKGKEQPVAIYEVLSLKNNASDRLQTFAKEYEKALELYQERKFSDASICLKKLLETFPNDIPSQMLAERCEYYVNNPPPLQWNGAFTALHK
ncbi:MAG: adenylate/guanylate cyclase domain-containing protein [Planctomycetota bacterium]|nr:adenylate/guanylate cyclase domain-containing protein [Planctomycetota bacterium]